MSVASGSNAEGPIDREILSRVWPGAAKGFDRESRCNVSLSHHASSVARAYKIKLDADHLCNHMDALNYKQARKVIAHLYKDMKVLRLGLDRQMRRR